ncbi:hypothetical protein Lal_00038360 [Lupinus albus]|nr:hypothetical protein Lal_00038360 [Lupinus albus]
MTKAPARDAAQPPQSSLSPPLQPAPYNAPSPQSYQKAPHPHTAPSLGEPHCHLHTPRGTRRCSETPGVRSFRLEIDLQARSSRVPRSMQRYVTPNSPRPSSRSTRYLSSMLELGTAVMTVIGVVCFFLVVAAEGLV